MLLYYFLPILCILLLAVPGLVGAVKTYRGGESGPSVSGAVGVALLTLVSTGMLLVALFADLLF